jgi:hypothetical protein
MSKHARYHIYKTETDWKNQKEKDIETPVELNMSLQFNNPSNSLKKDAKAPSSVSVLWQLIKLLNCPLLRAPPPTLVAGGAGVEAAGGAPDLLQKTWVAGSWKVD